MKNRSSYRMVWAIALSALFTGVFLSACIWIFSNFFNYTFDAIVENNDRQFTKDIRELTLVVASDTTLECIATELIEEDFIGSDLLFKLQSKLFNRKPLLEGTYVINNQMDNSAILNLLTSAKEDIVADVRFTIPEGFTIAQIANRLDDLGIVSRETFMTAVNDRTYPYSFLEHIPEDLPNRLEGYLFPDPYFVSPTATAEEIIIKMLNRFEQVTSQYTQNLYNSYYSLHDVLTIASIIEEEAKLSDERPIVSGVIYNRLEGGMKLQMCSTVQYALGARKATLSLDDLQVDSPFNTYINEGLPVGPICAPGEESIKAAFMPENHNYYYFVLNNAQVGSHTFSRTAEEHNANKARYQQLASQNIME